MKRINQRNLYNFLEEKHGVANYASPVNYAAITEYANE